ncbi:hypothetical protein Pse7367_0499 [Thalassoporum mexicanum PCC 7367]|nr:hypothetical protein [Pseudanabaena sp. PCC 7367]AFY68807.1 hypothetical protein Pse7367_0499 [Pseudanabaena sp. PCC 7367]
MGRTTKKISEEVDSISYQVPEFTLALIANISDKQWSECRGNVQRLWREVQNGAVLKTIEH